MLYRLLLAASFLLGLIATACTAGNPSRLSEMEQEVRLIELNHFYDDLGRHAYDQVILYEWSPDYRRYHVIAWSLVEDQLTRFPTYDSHRNVYFVRWYDRDKKVRMAVYSKLYRETWSLTDPERENKALFDERYRTGLIRR